MKAQKDQGKRLARVKLDHGAIQRIQQLWQVAGELFKCDLRTEIFLTSPHPLLGMRPPVSWAANGPDGLRDVLAAVRRLEHTTAP